MAAGRLVVCAVVRKLDMACWIWDWSSPFRSLEEMESTEESEEEDDDDELDEVEDER